MARLPRLSVPNQLHLVVHRSAGNRPVLVEARDLDAYQASLRDACARHDVALHAFALSRSQVWLLATPSSDIGLGATMQAVGRSFVASFNRRHARSGSLWDGRYRCAVIESGAHFLDCSRLVDSVPVRHALVDRAEDWSWSSAGHHTGLRRVAGVKDHPQWLVLGNTPFEREAAYRSLLEQPLDSNLAQRLESAAWFGWALGSSTFIDQIVALAGRRVAPLRRGRPAAGSPSPERDV